MGDVTPGGGRCPTCGASVRVESTGEGTSYFVPIAEAEVERLREALEPFVGAYEAIDFLHCPTFQGPLDLAFFDHAREVLRG